MKTFIFFIFYENGGIKVKEKYYFVKNARKVFNAEKTVDNGEYRENVAYCVVISAPEKNFFVHCQNHDCRKCKFLLYSAIKKLNGGR